MDNKLLVSLMSIGLVATVVGMGTFAYFSDTETSTGNTMTAGILDLEFGAGSALPMAIGDMKPSYHNYSGEIILNFRDNPGKLYKQITNMVCTQGTNVEPELVREAVLTSTCPVPGTKDPVLYSGVCDLDAVTLFDMQQKINGEWVTVIPETTQTIKDFEGKWLYLGRFDPNAQGVASVSIKQSFHMMSAADNEYQGDSCTFDEVFMVRQINDPFGSNPADNCYNVANPGLPCPGDLTQPQ